MFQAIKQWIENNSTRGIRFWFAFDPVTQKASVTLFMVYISFYLSLGASIYSLIKPTSLLTTVAIMTFNIILIVLYMIHKINKAKFDLDDKQFELSNEEKEEKK